MFNDISQIREKRRPVAGEQRDGPEHQLEVDFSVLRDRRSLQHDQHAEMLVSRSKAKFGLDLGLKTWGFGLGVTLEAHTFRLGQ